MTFSIDMLRKKFPTIGFALYAYEPSEPVTLEVIIKAGSFKFTQPTEEAAVKEFMDLIGTSEPQEEPTTQPAETETETEIEPDIFG